MEQLHLFLHLDEVLHFVLSCVFDNIIWTEEEPQTLSHSSISHPALYLTWWWANGGHEKTFAVTAFCYSKVVSTLHEIWKHGRAGPAVICTISEEEITYFFR